MKKKLIALIILVAFVFWIFSPFVARAETNKKAVINVETSLNLREKPTEDSRIVKELSPREIVELISNTDNGWSKIRTEDRKTGYVKSCYLIKVDKEIVMLNKHAVLLNTAVVTKDHSSSDRNFNMSKACQKIDGLILEPGETFNWYGQNGVGPADKAHGYKKTTVLSGGKGVPGYGGGVCQVATALYNSIYGIGIDADVHYVHSEKQPYVKKGMVEATVAYGQKNFVFHNTMDYPIMFVAYAESCGENDAGGRAIVSVYKVIEN